MLGLHVFQTLTCLTHARATNCQVMIDELVVKRFRSPEAASAAIRDIIISGFASEARATLVLPDDPDIDAKEEAISNRGGRPHNDPRIVEIWSEGLSVS